MIKELNPKYLKLKSFGCSDSGFLHFHSFDLILKFLQSPNLHTLKLHLQLHFISSIYDNNQIKNNNSKFSGFGKDKIELDFNEMDNFKFIDFGNIGNYLPGAIRFIVYGDIKFYIDNGINEDNQIYCSFKIPPYSKSLWKQCLKLLSTNSTITNLSISHNCGGCSNECGWDENSLFNENFLNDFMNSLANNTTIKTLTLNFINCEDYQNKNLINKSIASMLDQNTTLESIHIFLIDMD
ncbi:hypothetical protein ACTFIW_000211 [Dictyostelium discoideum]